MVLLTTLLLVSKMSVIVIDQVVSNIRITSPEDVPGSYDVCF